MCPGAAKLARTGSRAADCRSRYFRINSQIKFKEEARTEIAKLKEILGKRAKDPEIIALEAELSKVEGEVSEMKRGAERPRRAPKS